MKNLFFNAEEEEIKKIIREVDLEFEFFEEEAKEVSDEALSIAIKKFDPFFKYATPFVMWIIPIFI